jgi:hypothetical protein
VFEHDFDLDGRRRGGVRSGEDANGGTGIVVVPHIHLFPSFGHHPSILVNSIRIPILPNPNPFDFFSFLESKDPAA